jgi:hypothetical protein
MVANRFGDGVPLDEIGVFTRSDRELKRARSAGKAAGAASVESTSLKRSTTPTATCSMSPAPEPATIGW